MRGFMRFIRSSRLLTVGAIAFAVTLAATLAAFLCDRLGFGIPWLLSGLHAVSVLGGPTAAVTLTAADTRNGIRRIGRNIEASERSEEK